jgi:hypothetical protein
MHTHNLLLAMILSLFAAAPVGAEEVSAQSLSIVVQMKFSSGLMFQPKEIERTFTKEFRQQIGARLAQDLGRSDVTTEHLTPRNLSFRWDGSDVTGMTHAFLQLDLPGIEGNDEEVGELWNELNAKAPPGVVEMFAQHIGSLLEEHWQRATEQKRKVRQQLASDQADLLGEIMSYVEKQESGREVGRESIKSHIEQLTKRLQDDEIRLIELQAQRAAIEKRIDKLHAQAAEGQREDPLLAALRAEVERHQKNISRDGPNSTALEAAKEILAAEESVFKDIEQLRSGNVRVVTSTEVDRARGKVAEARLRVAQIQSEKENQRALLVEKLTQAKIALLQHERAGSEGRVTEQINKLSDMLDELAIEMDTIAGRREGIEKALVQQREDLKQAVEAELESKRLQSEISMLENRKAQIELQLLQVEAEIEGPAPEKIEILPVIP